jgi:hypothetical protein
MPSSSPSLFHHHTSVRTFFLLPLPAQDFISHPASLTKACGCTRSSRLWTTSPSTNRIPPIIALRGLPRPSHHGCHHHAAPVLEDRWVAATRGVAAPRPCRGPLDHLCRWQLLPLPRVRNPHVCSTTQTDLHVLPVVCTTTQSASAYVFVQMSKLIWPFARCGYCNAFCRCNSSFLFCVAYSLFLDVIKWFNFD